MSGATLKPAKGINPKEFDKFRNDLSIVLTRFTQRELGQAMGIQPSNINRYVNGNLAITKMFLKKFYAAWGERINEINIFASPRPPVCHTSAVSLQDILTRLERIEAKLEHIH